VTQFPTPARAKLLPVVITGHVDHGKSTFIGRLLNDTGTLADGKVEALREMSRRRGMPFEWSFVMDALQAERDQGITIDTSQVRFCTEARDYLVIDAPGHKEFLKNMVTGAAAAEAAVLVVDVGEGMSEQSRRHAFLLHLLGIRDLIVAVNKLDAVAYAEAPFRRVSADIAAYLAEIGLSPTAVVPVSARHGDNVAGRSDAMPWYDGPTVVEALDALQEVPEAIDRPLRLPVQDVYKFDERRIIVGRIETGRLRVGDSLAFSPGNRSGRIVSIERWNAGPAVTAGAGQSVGITLAEDLFVERGDVASTPADLPQTTQRLRARIFWFGRTPLKPGDRYTLKLGMAEHAVEVERIERVLDVETLTDRSEPSVRQSDVADVILTSRKPIVVDDAGHGAHLGRGVLVGGYDIVGGALIETAFQPATETRRADRAPANPVPANVTPVRHAVSLEERAALNGHRGGILWLTGLSGAGKSSLAMALERELVSSHFQVVVLDGDNLRSTLNADLGFSPADRGENIRRIAEMAAFLAETGILAIVACISPLRADRERARLRGGVHFHEIYVNAPLAACEARDVKGLYARARRGEIAEFSGVSAPYEPPVAPNLELRTDQVDLGTAIGTLVGYVEANFRAPTERHRIAG
jgi:bifunctional enzyme CysN/CysC